jgi:HPt (histidine-containing phosphotransfer) domain-containing protein
MGTALRRDAEHEAHKLAGSLGMFGFPTGSELARELELMLEGDAPIGDDFAELVARLAAVLPPQ